MSKRGRRPRGGTPAPAATITALAEELTFLTILGESVTSLGVQRVIQRLLDLDPEAAEVFKQALWVKERAREIIQERGEETSQVTIYRYISGHYFELADEWKNRNG